MGAEFQPSGAEFLELTKFSDAGFEELGFAGSRFAIKGFREDDFGRRRFTGANAEPGSAALGPRQCRRSGQCGWKSSSKIRRLI